MLKQNSILKYEAISTIVIMILGTIFHFTYNWSNNNVLVGVFTPINESIWEHLKLVFFTMFLTTMIVYFLEGKNFKNYLCAKTIGIIISLIFTTSFFYTYTGIIGNHFPTVDIASFFVSVILGQLVAYRKINLNKSCNKLIAIIILVVLSLCFIIFTFYPPHINLFKDPITGLFGIYKTI